MKNLMLRAGSGIVYVGLIVGAILLGSGWFLALALLLSILAVNEFQHIVLPPAGGPVERLCRFLDILAAAAMIVVAYCISHYNEAFLYPALAIVGFYPLVRFTAALYDKSPRAYSSVPWSLMSMVYIALPLSLLVLLYDLVRPSGAMLVLTVFVMIWLNDTGAYCVGSLCGRRKLFERLSPKKSWEGFFGGLLFCIAAGGAASWLMPDYGISMIAWMGLGALVCVFSTWGDLFESLLKRSHSIKDSGNLIPGHGGILDRIDSLLFVAPVSFFYFMILHII